MTTNFPTTLDTNTELPVETGTTKLSINHVINHTNVRDAVKALEAKVGVDSSAVTSTHDYKLSTVTGSDKAVALTATQTVTNKSLGSGTKLVLGSDATGDIWYRHTDGTVKRLAIGSSADILVVSGGVPAWQAPTVTSNASTTVAGIVELATLAETLARTTTGGTGAKLVVTPDNLTKVLAYDGVVDTGSGSAYAIAPTPALTAYVTYQEFTFKAVNANTVTNPTLAVSGLASPKTIVNPDGSALLVGQITANSIVRVVYDGTNMVLASPTNFIDYNTIPNVIGKAQTWHTMTVYPTGGSFGWTVAGTPAYGANGFTVTGSATNSMKGQFAKLADATAGSNAFTAMKFSYSFRNGVISSGTTAFGSGDIWFFHGWATSATISTIADITNTTRRVGFAHYNGRIYAITGNNTGVTATNIQADSSATREYLVDYTTTAVNFYINGVLVATHTTNIINDGTTTFWIFGGQDSDSTTASIFMTPVTISTLMAV